MAVPCLWRRTDGSTGSEIPNAIALLPNKMNSERAIRALYKTGESGMLELDEPADVKPWSLFWADPGLLKTSYAIIAWGQCGFQCIVDL
ncbi:MAG: hypothetical protein DMG65_26655 [Candidatus Angelobacter sp. Gp1-AA117]|nr:MAG: hypothetical protein DMG65_26655 [Candidatus Angelobacter sp. Gp1-AA117]